MSSADNAGILDVSTEMLLKILSYLDRREVVHNVELACKSLHAAAEAYHKDVKIDGCGMVMSAADVLVLKRLLTRRSEVIRFLQISNFKNVSAELSGGGGSHTSADGFRHLFPKSGMPKLTRLVVTEMDAGFSSYDDMFAVANVCPQLQFVITDTMASENLLQSVPEELRNASSYLCGMYAIRPIYNSYVRSPLFHLRKVCLENAATDTILKLLFFAPGMHVLSTSTKGLTGFFFDQLSNLEALTAFHLNHVTGSPVQFPRQELFFFLHSRPGQLRVLSLENMDLPVYFDGYCLRALADAQPNMEVLKMSLCPCSDDDIAADGTAHAYAFTKWNQLRVLISWRSGFESADLLDENPVVNRLPLLEYLDFGDDALTPYDYDQHAPILEFVKRRRDANIRNSEKRGHQSLKECLLVQQLDDGEEARDRATVWEFFATCPDGYGPCWVIRPFDNHFQKKVMGIIRRYAPHPFDWFRET